jgi:NADPH:quinone reductase
MKVSNELTGLLIRSTAKSTGAMEVALKREPVPEPADDEVLIRVQGAPINPSDLALLFGAGDLRSARETGTADAPVLTMPIPELALGTMAGRLDDPMMVGNEGAGVVVRAGASPQAQALLGRTVATFSGGMFAQYRCAKAAACMALPDGVTPAEGASCFVNPLTALALLDAMKRGGHTAAVQTAAASNLGQMLVRVCHADGIELVNIVRSQEQEGLLRSQGAVHVFDSNSPTFEQDLTSCLIATGATAVFDAIGGGTLGGRIMACIEAAQAGKMKVYSRYGSGVNKDLYIYGALDLSPTVIDRRGLGFAFSVNGFLVTAYLQKIGAEAAAKLRSRVLSELKTTFASHYAQSIQLAEMLKLANVSAYAKRSTGGKFLVIPNPT